MTVPAGVTIFEPIVPEAYAATRSDVPLRARTVRGLAALPLVAYLWVAPKRAGPALAASGWRAAVAAHLIALLYGLGLIIWAEFIRTPIATPAAKFTLREYIRAPIAALVVPLHGAAASGTSPASATGIVLGIEAGLIVFALLVMPFAASGESARRLFGRYLRLTWWSTSLLLPLGVAWFLDPQIRPLLGLSPSWHPADYVALAAFGLYWFTVLLRSGYRYAGPPDGPAWEPRTPRCEGCGYTIAHLPIATNCPECGRPVAESLAQRRHPPPFGSARGISELARAYRQTVNAIIRDRSFFANAAVDEGHARARTFFLWTCMLNAGLLAALFFAFAISLPSEARWSVVASTIVVFAALIIFEALLGGAAAAIVALAARRPIQPTATTTFYALGAMIPTLHIPLTGLIIVTALLITVVFGERARPEVLLGSVLGVGALVIAASFIASFIAAAQILRRALRQTRFANA